VGGRAGSPECFLPALARPTRRCDYKAVFFDPKFNGILEAALFDEGLGDSDTSRISNTHKFNLHDRQ
jgi:hypothetical protein